jgi:hypothetical protein
MSACRGVTAGLASLLTILIAAWAAVAPGCAAAPWPSSRGALLSEVATGGSSASDEFVEIYNAGSVPVELGGCELAYASASGSSAALKVAFATPLSIGPGQHLLAANAAGIYAATADATYAGGLAGDGGTLVLRRGDGSVIDALSWGTAVNSYVEGVPAPAPPAGSSLERRPGSPAGNWLDSNDNSADWLVRANPHPQAMAAAPEPAATETPSGDPTIWISDEPSAELSAQPSPTALPSSTAQPSPTIAPGSIGPSEPAPSPDPSPSDLESIGQARLRQPGAHVHVAGSVSMAPGLKGSELLLAIADPSGGIFVRLPSPAGLRVGQPVEAAGALSAPYGQLEIRDLSLLVLGPQGDAPAPVPARPADIGEGLEGSLVSLEGLVESVQGEDGRLVLEIGDGDCSVRVFADPLTGISKADVSRGQMIRVTGVVGQHATATGKLDGYKLWLRGRDDLDVLSIDPGVTDYPDVDPSVEPLPSVVFYTDLATGLAVRGRWVDVTATVTAPAGIIDWGGPTIVVDDGTAAVAVILPDGAAQPRIGERVRVVGRVSSLHNGRRVLATVVEPLSGGAVPVPQEVAGAVAAQDEWRLVTVVGRITRLTRAGVRWRADLSVAGEAVAVLGEPGAGVSTDGLVPGRLAMVTGIVRRSTSDSDLFYVVPRGAADLRLGPPVPGASVSSQGGPGGSGSDTGQGSTGGAAILGGTSDAGGITAVSDLGGLIGREVTVAGLIVAVEGCVAVLDDGTGRVRLGGEAAADAICLLQPGDAVEVSGTVSQDSEGLLVAVDPERILALPGGGGPGDWPAVSVPADDGTDPEATHSAAGSAAPALPGAQAGRAALAVTAQPGPGPVAVALLILLGLLAVLTGAVGLAALAVPGLRLRLHDGLIRAVHAARRAMERARRLAGRLGQAVVQRTPGS